MAQAIIACGDDDFHLTLQRGDAVFDALRACVQASGEPCEGNLFHRGNSWRLEPEMVGKQKSLFALVRSLPSSKDIGRSPRVLEIGFNAGHSACLMLLAHPEVRVVAFDLCEHAYAKPCAETLQRFFGLDRVELVEGPSGSTLPAYHVAHPEISFDLFHVDGGHQYLVAMDDMRNCRALSLKSPCRKSLVVLDDVDLVGISTVWEDCVAAGSVLELSPLNAMGRFKHAIGEFLCEDGLGVCASCGKHPAPWACGGCRFLRYCCESCGRTHWKQHRRVCESRQPPPLSFPSLSEIVPGSTGMLSTSADGSVLIAARALKQNEELCFERPFAWQPSREARLQRCSHCGIGSQDGARLRCCGVCTFVARCEKCWHRTCHMCPELKITGGSVAPITLLALDLIRQRAARSLSSKDFVLPCEGAVDSRHRAFAAQVQRVGHFCSAVKWTDEAAAEVIAAIMPGVHEVRDVGLCYFPTLARFRAVDQRRGAQINLEWKVASSSEHAFSFKVIAKHHVLESALVSISSDAS